jgi:Ran-binding protein 9/10
MPGWTDNSYAYHGDDGHIFEEGDHLSAHRLDGRYPTYGAGDVVGCGIDWELKTVYFVKNGVRLGGEGEEGEEGKKGVACHMVSGRLYPVIGLGDEMTEVKVNFGDEPFVYDHQG